MLATSFRTLRNEGNQNNEIGLPLTLLRLGPDHRAAVLEMGMYAGGEIAELAQMARPRIGVVTAVHGVHMSRMGSLAAIEQAKGELVEALPSDGFAVLNQDDRRVRRMADRTAARVLTYGLVRRRGRGRRRRRLRRVRRDALHAPAPGGPRRPARPPRRRGFPGLGKLSVHNALAGAAVGHAAGIEPPRIVHALAGGWSAAHRGQVIRLGRVALIDDSYNASPPSVTAALDLLAGLPGRRVAVLGEMLELGQGRGDRPQRGRDRRGGDRRPAGRRSGRAPPGSPRARRPPGSTRRASSRRAIARPRSTSCASGCATATSSWSRRRAASSSTCSSRTSRAELSRTPR